VNNQKVLADMTIINDASLKKLTVHRLRSKDQTHEDLR